MSTRLEEFFAQSSFAAPDCIVVATALSDLEYLVPQAIAEAEAAHAELAFVHAIVQGELPVQATYYNPLKADRDARLTLEVMARHVRARGLTCVTAVRHGAVRDVVDEMVQETCAGRLLLGARSKDVRAIAGLGSVSRQLLTHQWIPVSCVSPGKDGGARAQLAPKTILYPVTSSKATADYTKLVRDLSKYFHAELVVMHASKDGAMASLTAGSCAAACPLGLWPEAKRIVKPEVNAKAILETAHGIGADLILLDRPDLFDSEPGLQMISEVVHTADCQILVGHCVTPGSDALLQLSALSASAKTAR